VTRGLAFTPYWDSEKYSLERFLGVVPEGAGFPFALALPLAGAFTFTAFASAFVFLGEVFLILLLEGLFLTFFNASPASCDREVWPLISGVGRWSSLTPGPSRFDRMIPKTAHFQHLFVYPGGKQIFALCLPSRLGALRIRPSEGLGKISS